MIKKILRNFCLISLLLLITISCTEETIQPEFFGSIEGTVVEAREDSLVIPIGGASVTTAPATTSIVTDANGKFSYPDVSTGSYTVTVTKVGFEKKAVTVSVRDNETTPVTIQLEKSPPDDGPGKATDPFPENEAIDQNRFLDLGWGAPLVEDGTIIKYDVYLYDSKSPVRVLISQDLEDTTIHVSDLEYNKSYFWQVDSKFADTLVTQGDVWSFSTREQPDYRLFYASNRFGNYEIFTSDSLEEDVIRLTDRPFRDWWPRLNPDRRTIAFSSDSDIDNHIFLMNRDGTDIHRVTTIPIAGFHNNGIGFSWSHDGGKLLYSHYNQLYTVNENGANLTLIATAPAGRHFRECEFSNSGDKIVVLTMGEKSYDNEIYTMNANGSNMTMVVGNLPGTVNGPTWSIDGSQIMYTYDVSGFESPTGRQLDARVFILTLSDTTTTDISENKLDGTNDSFPRFSPDGSHVIFENTTNDGFNPKNIWRMDVNGDNRTELFQNAETPDWK